MEVKEIFVNLSVKDLDKTKKFFSNLGFKFDSQFTNKDAACMILGKNIYAMLLVEKFFNTFIPGRKILDTKREIEVLNAISVNNKEKVDEMIKKVIDSGGKEYRSASDYGWMYSRSFEDLDGHIWEVMYADKSKMSK